MRQFREGSWGSLSRAVKPRDVPDTHAVRAGGTNWRVRYVLISYPQVSAVDQGQRQGAELEQPCSDLLQPSSSYLQCSHMVEHLR